MYNELRLVLLAAATGKIRTETMNDMEYLVVPVVALVEGVIHPVNAKAPEFVSGKVLAQAAHTWNGRPLVLGHPDIAGVKVSANAPRILEKYAFGTIFESTVVDNKLTQEAWIDPVRLEALDKQLLADLREGKSISVSVGAHVGTKIAKGKHGNKAYSSEWVMALGDHLAFLPQAAGACSLEMGCGTHMTAAEGAPSMSMTDKLRGLVDQLRAAISTTESDQDQRRAILQLLKEQERDVWDITALYKDRIVYPVYGNDGNTTYYERTFSGNSKDGYVLDGPRIEVKQAPIKFVPAEAAIEEPVAPAAEPTVGATAEEDRMNKEQRAAAIKALTECPCSGFTATDVKMLEAASDERLEAFRVASEKKKADDAKVAADLKAAQDATAAATTKLAAAEANALKPEELTSLRALQAEKDARDSARKTELVTKLETAAKTAYTKDELTAMDLSSLEKLATLMAVEAPVVDFSARGVAQPRLVGAQKRDYTPPDPYAPKTTSDKTTH